MFELIATMKDPINLSIGQPDFDTPEPIQEAAIRAIRSGKNKYTVTQGLPELNEGIIERYGKRYNCRPEASIVTSGVSGAIFLAFLSLLDPDDEILIPDPYFVMYNHLTHLCGARVVTYDLYPDFQIKVDRLAALVTEKTKILFLNSPQNPTGAVLDEKDLKSIAALAKKHGLLIVSDEIYDEFVYDEKYHSICEYYDKVLLLGGFSKTFAVPGWRIGWAAGPAEVIDTMRTFQQFSYVCAPAPLQYGALEALSIDMGPWIKSYRIKRDLVCAGLQDRYELVCPKGSFYAFPKIPDGITEKEFIRRALKKNLLIVPGSAFSSRDTHFRISFAASDRNLERGIKVLRSLA